jgi:hypothetical protein
MAVAARFFVIGGVRRTCPKAPVIVASPELLVIVDSPMRSVSVTLGLAAGIVGALLCLVAGIARLAGAHHLAGFENATLFIVGSALMIFACMVRLYWPDNK